MKSLPDDVHSNSSRRAIAIVLAAWLFVHGSAFQPLIPSHPRHHQPHDVLQWIGFQRCQEHRPSPKPLLYHGNTKDAYIVRNNKEYLIETLGFREDRIQRMEENEHMYLTLDIGVIGERANWLRKRLKMKQKEIKKIAQKEPEILGLLSATNLAPKLDFLHTRLLLDDNGLKKLIQSQPGILCRPVTNLAPKLDYLQTRLLLDDNGLKKIILSAPSILACSIEENIEPKLDWLQQRLDLDDDAVGKLISRQPYTLACSITKNLEPTLEWLQRRLDLDDAAAGKIIQKYPNILTFNIESNIEPKLEWLQQRLDLDGAAVGKMIKSVPSILTYSIDKNLEPKLDWIQQRLALTDGGLSNFVLKSPTIFCYNVDNNLEPTLDFYTDALGDEQEALALVIYTPTLLNNSLEKRLKPRLEEIRGAGIVIDTAWILRIGKSTDKQWRKVMQKLDESFLNS